MYRLLHEHLETLLAEARARSDGDGLPHFVERELREFLTCGHLARGFARFRCDRCPHDLLVPFSCKGRGFCPSCTGRRMATLAAHLVDDMLGGLPVRQWVLTTPHRLRYALAYDHRLCRRVLAVFMLALLSFERRRARRRGVADGRGGAVTAILRWSPSEPGQGISPWSSEEEEDGASDSTVVSEAEGRAASVADQGRA